MAFGCLVGAAPARGQGSTGPAGAAGPAPALRALSLASDVVAPGGRVRLRVGPGPDPASIQEWQGTGWAIVRRLPASSAERLVVVRAPLRVTRLRYRVAVGELRGPARRVAMRPLRLAAVGDVNLGDGPGGQIARFGPAWPWRSAGPVLRAADLALANLECAISDRGSPWEKQYTFRGRASSLRAAATVGGLDVVNLANNHSVDFGRTALLDTLRAARAAGIAPVGAGATDAQAYRPVVVERLGLRVAFVGFSEILPFEFRAGPHTPGTAWAFDDRIRAGVRAARREADVVVATFHWGTERRTTEEPDQRAWARLALASGAAAVIGAHPHVLQPTRRVGRRGLVAYSLGNFVFGAGAPGTIRTEVLTLGLGADGVRTVTTRTARIVGGRPVLAPAR